MYYHIHLSDQQIGSVDQNGTNSIQGKDACDSSVKLTWKLEENSTVKKFIDVTKSVAESKSRVIDWNYYKTGIDQSVPILVKQLNHDIESYPLADDFKIKLSSSSKEELYDKTNKIHYAFEKLLVESSPTDKQKEILERLNKLVHEIEHNISNYFDNTFDQEHFIVCRHVCSNSDNLYQELQNEDYNRFIFQNETCDLFLDFFTVGKDLGHAFMSNDIALVHNKEIKQQRFITASVQIGIVKKDQFQAYDPEIGERQTIQYKQWCEKNKVDSFGYNYKESKYNLGRCKLGTLINDTYDTFVNKLCQHPYISNITITET